MSNYVVRRLLLTIPLLLGITIINYVVFAIAPGDPVIALIDPRERALMSREDIEKRREHLGLNDPIPVRYAIWLGQALRGNLGYSIIYTKPVGELLVTNIGRTIGLVSLSMVISTLGGIVLGAISALRRYSFTDYALTLFAFTGTAMPGFFLALLLIYVVSLRLGLLPPGGVATPGQPPSWEDRFLHMILPVAALSYESLASLLRYTRSSMLEVLNMEYVTTARAKGLAERVVIMRHAFRNAMLPAVTIIGLRLPGLLAGALLIETVFNFQGIGLLMVQATRYRDYPLLMGSVLVSATAVLFANLIADLAYAWVDPRIRYE